MPTAAEKPRRSHAPVVARYQAKRLAEGKCRRCGTRPRMLKADGQASPYCQRCRARASAYEVRRLASRRAAGQASASPSSPEWKFHLAAPDGGPFAACGAKSDANTTSDIEAVTCGNCSRTAAFRAAAADAVSNAYEAGPGFENRDAPEVVPDDFAARPRTEGMGRMALELRDYQDELAQRCYSEWRQNPAARIMLQLPTGGGKTEIAAAIAMRQHQAGVKVMFVAHRRGLIGQTVRRFADYGLPAVAGSDTGGVAGPSEWLPGSPQPDGLVVVGVDTYRRRLAAGSVAIEGLLIIDEAHTTAGVADRQSLFANHEGPLLALTATPWRLNRDEGFRNLCGALFKGPSVAELIDRGYLARYMAWNLADLNLPEQHRGESDNRYAARVWKSVSVAIKSALTERAVERYMRFERRRPDSKGIVFALTLDHAERLRVLFQDAGLHARVLRGTTTSRERAEILSSFARPNSEGGCAAIINVGIIREGFDAPESDILLILRPTKSLALHCQMIGRVMRPKTDGRPAQILDLAGNIARLDHLPDTPQDWSLDPRGYSDGDGEGEFPVITCRGAVDLDDDGYISDDSGGLSPDGFRTPRRNCFPTPGVDPDGCGAMLPPGTHICVCGLSFRKQCLAAPDGCGAYRSVKNWRGDRRDYRMGACDECCRFHELDERLKRANEERMELLALELAEQAQAVARKATQAVAQLIRPLAGRSRAASQKASDADCGLSGLIWDEAKTGNGWLLHLAPPGVRMYSIWVGRRGIDCVAGMIPFDPPPTESEPLRALRQDMLLWNLPRDPDDDPLGHAKRLLEIWAHTHPDWAELSLGKVCQSCRSRLHSARLAECPLCASGANRARPVAEREPDPLPSHEAAAPSCVRDCANEILNQAARLWMQGYKQSARTMVAMARGAPGFYGCDICLDRVETFANLDA